MQGTATRRKGGAVAGASSSSSSPLSASTSAQVPVATVKRRKWGTSPFDEHWLNVDCCGLFCALLTYFLHGYGCYAVCWIVIPPWMSTTLDNKVRTLTLAGHLNCAAFCIIAALACYAHFKAMTTDPGAVPPDAKPLPEPEEEQEAGGGGGLLDATQPQSKQPGLGGDMENDNGGTAPGGASLDVKAKKRPIRMCRRCNAFKPKRAHHCSVCKRCIIKMDHHCPWVNNCVGIGNHKYFLLFVFYTALSCMYSLSLLAMRFVACTAQRTHFLRSASGHGAHRIHCLDEPTHLVYILLLLVEAMLFGLFTCCMKVDQWDVVTSNLTHIDKLKGQSHHHVSSGNSRRFIPGVTEVFGVGKRGGRHNNSRFRFDWISPFAQVCFPTSIRDEIFGYCQSPCSSLVRNNNKKHMEDIESMEMMPLTSSTNSGNSSGRMVRSVTEIV